MASLSDDLSSDLDAVFLSSADFASPALLRPGLAGEVGVNVLVASGLGRYVGQMYVKPDYEIRVPLSALAVMHDEIQILDGDGMPLAQYKLTEPLDKDSATMLFAARSVDIS